LNAINLSIQLFIGIIIFFILAFLIIIYNSFVRLENNIKKAWSNIDVSLKQRNEELNNLVEVVKGYMKYEKELLTDITKTRNLYGHANTITEKAQANNKIIQTTKSLFAVIENYPDLKANENVLKLQKRITELENIIADRREYYNDSVNIYNMRCEQIPYVFLAKLLKYKHKEMFTIKDSETTKNL